MGQPAASDPRRFDGAAVYVIVAGLALFYSFGGTVMGVGGLLGGMANEASTREAFEVEQATGTRPFLVAATELHPGTRVRQEDLYAVEISPRWVPVGVVPMEDLDALVGRTVAETILANEFIRERRLAP